MTNRLINAVGIGLRSEHYQSILEQLPTTINWLEVHSENYFGDGGMPHFYLEKIAQHYPLSFHGTGLSLGSADGISKVHLAKLKKAVDKYNPKLVSEHLSWSAVNGTHTNDLLPLPYTSESLNIICDNIKQTQDYLGRQILIENPSSYLRFAESDIAEWDFFAKLPSLTGCGLLLDVNNIFVTCHNHNYDPTTYLQAINGQDVQEIHMAGFAINTIDGQEIFIDDHGSEVRTAVWLLLEKALNLMGNKPILVEWDTNIPKLDVLLQQAKIANKILQKTFA